MAAAESVSAKKGKKQQTLHLAEFLSPGMSGGNWADEDPDAEETPTLPTRPGEASSGPLKRQLPDAPPYKVFIGNLPYDASAEDLGGLFWPQLASLLDSHIIKTAEGKPRGCFVEFGDRSDLEKALQMDGTALQGRSLRIDLAEARPDDRSGRSRGGYPEAGGRGDARRTGYGFDAPGFREDFRQAPSRGAHDGGYPESRGSFGSRGSYGSSYGDRDRDRGPRGGMPSDRQGGFSNGRAPDGLGPPSRSFDDEPRGRRRDGGFADREFGAGRPGDEQWGRRPSGPPPEAAPTEPDAPKERPRLQLAPRSKASTEPAPAPAPAASSARTNPFGSAKPVDATARLKELEEREAKRKAEEAVQRAAAAEAARRAADEEKALQGSNQHGPPDRGPSRGLPSAPRGGRGRPRGAEGVRGPRGGRGEGRGPGPEAGHQLHARTRPPHTQVSDAASLQSLDSVEQPTSAPAPGTPMQQPPFKQTSQDSSEPVLDFTSAGSSLGLDPDAGFQIASNSRGGRNANRGAKVTPTRGAPNSPAPPGLPQQSQSTAPPGLQADQQLPSKTQLANAFAALNADDE